MANALTNQPLATLPKHILSEPRVYSGGHFPDTCPFCGLDILVPFSRRFRIRHFCCHAHYIAFYKTPHYKEHRQGQRRARKIVSAHFPLKPGYEVHHHDGDNDNNCIPNLAVFASSAEHMSFHRGGLGKPIWDGATVAESSANPNTGGTVL